MGVVGRLAFDTDRSDTRIHWDTAQRLGTGSLVALSPVGDNFKSKCWVATVACRILKGGLTPGENEGPETPPRIHILWADQSTAVMDPTVMMVMIETCQGYYEAVKHGMAGLRDAAKERLV
jgi:helicase required for RNAi-mediated heterochromatin assembly 1